MSPQEAIAKPKDGSGLKPAVSTPTRRQYWSSLRTMLSPERFSLREEQFFLAGGTGLGLRLGHRVSRDIDWFTPKPFNAHDVVRALEALPAGTGLRSPSRSADPPSRYGLSP